MLNKPILLDSLRELSSKELQEVLWLRGDSRSMSSFTEAICGVFDDSGLTRALESRRFQAAFSDELCRKVVQLDRAIARIPEEDSPSVIIQHPDMELVRALSRELLTLFEKELPDN